MNPIPALRPALIASLLCLAVAPLLAAEPAQPAAKAGPKSATPVEMPAAAAGATQALGGGKPTGAALTRDQLRACIKSQAELKSGGEALRAEKAELGALSAELEKNEAALVAERAAVDATRQEAVDAFNARLQSTQSAAGELKARQIAFNQKVDAYQSGGEAFKRDCANRPYAEADWFAIQRGK